MEIIDNDYIPEKILDEEWLPTYWEQLQKFQDEIYHLNTFNYIVNQIAIFPFHLFTNFPMFSNEPDIVWDYFLKGAFDSSVLIFNKICIDNRKDVITLPKFRKYIKKKIIKESDRIRFNNNYENLNFDTKFKPYEKFIKDERHLRIAHLNKEIKASLESKDINRRNTIGINLNKICNLINEYFEVVSLGKKFSNTYSQYLENNNSKSDLENLLDLVVKNSRFFNSPEKEPEKWETGEFHLRGNDLKIFNSYRIKFKLSPIIPLY